MKKIMFLSILVLTMAGCRSQKEVVIYERDVNNIELKVGSSCEVKFRTNASTGFFWQLTNLDQVSVVDTAGKRYESNAPKGMVGASSTLYWKFTAKKKGTETLNFIYARGSRKDTARTRDITFVVK